MHRHGSTAGPCRFAQEGGLAAIALDQMHDRRPQHRQHQAGQPCTAAQIGQDPGTGRPVAPELPAVDDVSSPRIGERRGTNQVDALLPALQQVEIGLKPIECFT